MAQLRLFLFMLTCFTQLLLGALLRGQAESCAGGFELFWCEEVVWDARPHPRHPHTRPPCFQLSQGSWSPIFNGASQQG